jgi:hypothetical protein
VAVAGGGVDQDGDLRPGRTEGKGPLVGPGQAQGHEDGKDSGFRFDDSDGLRDSPWGQAVNR